MIKRLRLKFIIITMTIITAMLTILLLSHYDFTVDGLIQHHINALEEAARDYRNGPPPGFEEMDMGSPGGGKPDWEGRGKDGPGRPHLCFILQLDSQGNLEFDGRGYLNLTDREMLLDIYQRAAEKNSDTGVLWDYELRFLRSGGPEQPFYVFTDISSEIESMQEMGRNTILIWFLGLVCFLLLTIGLAHWAVRPVEKAWEQQRQFVADASHELKTPLTVILTNAEMLRETADSTEQQKFADSIVTMSVQMRGLVENMLQLARADSGQTADEREKLDWSALVEQTILPFEPLFFEAGLTLESSIRPGMVLTGNAVQLRRVAEVLLDNALKYASPGGSVQVKLESRGCQCCLRVASTGQTLTPEQCRNIFKRFYRIDPARSRDGSYGLGLSIAARVVSDHRGKIWAEGRDGVNTFYVNLPLN